MNSLISLQNRQGLYGIAGPLAPGGFAARKEETLRLAQALVAADVPVLQLRDKWASSRELLELAHALRDLTRKSGAMFIVNDRPDIAVLSEADGVHVGQDDLKIADIRRFEQALGRTQPLIVGLSTHNLAQVREAVKSGADYLGFGPVFSTQTKENPDPVCGTELLQQAVKEAGSLPVVAIGGIGLEQAKDVQLSGARFVAVIADIAKAEDPECQARGIHRLWD